MTQRHNYQIYQIVLINANILQPDLRLIIIHFDKIEKIPSKIEINHIKIKSFASKIAMYHYVF